METPDSTPSADVDVEGVPYITGQVVPGAPGSDQFGSDAPGADDAEEHSGRVWPFLFEWRWNGQTPGKRLLHLRAIKVDGSPVSWIDVLLRNLARPIDAFGPMGLIGLLMIFVSPKAQRLGDLMARTLVIHETPIDWSIFDEDPAVPASTAPSRAATARAPSDARS